MCESWFDKVDTFARTKQIVKLATHADCTSLLNLGLCRFHKQSRLFIKPVWVKKLDDVGIGLLRKYPTFDFYFLFFIMYPDFLRMVDL